MARKAYCRVWEEDARYHFEADMPSGGAGETIHVTHTGEGFSSQGKAVEVCERICRSLGYSPVIESEGT